MSVLSHLDLRDSPLATHYRNTLGQTVMNIQIVSSAHARKGVVPLSFPGGKAEI